MSKRPMIFETESLEPDAPSPAEVPPVPDDALPQGAMVTVVGGAARKRSFLTRFALWALTGLVTLWVSTAAYDFVLGLMQRNIWLGRLALVLVAAVALVVVLALLRELAGLARLRRVDRLQALAREALAGDRPKALDLVDALAALYRSRERLRLGVERMVSHRDQVMDADALVHLAEREICGPLDAAAVREIEAASRSVAAATALVPLALADVAVALVANIRMVRRVAEIYGGRAGTLGSLRLLRAVAAHLVATGAVAVGDDMISSVAGGGVLSKVSRRFGEGVVNGALTARVGVATMEVCRPLPFGAVPRPRVTGLVKRALTGLFGKG
ncbi:YcjF family protein [Algicella marina]|uniref:TIGR01620 family protein n=1 Tax=Algicella marina TaxID=2683284 RepID=A0A6P1T2X5_9RHOB|nr:TIGR01620 family protein [Algicella marina]QHQ36091.1 TIGR01620 family protein [Algicella marina]